MLTIDRYDQALSRGNTEREGCEHMAKLVDTHLGEEQALSDLCDADVLSPPSHLPDAPENTQHSPHQPATLSLSMIVKDEEQVIERLLKNVAPFVDEIVIVDTGSTDNTVEICKRYGAKVYHFNWIDDFSAARNEALSHCTCDWILWLDADDVLPLQSIQHLQGTKLTLLGDHLDVVYAPYHCQFDAYGNCTSSVLRERLIRRGANYQWVYRIHESILIPATARTTQNPLLVIEHRKPKNLMERSYQRNNRILEKALAEKRTYHMVFQYALSFIPSQYDKARALFTECLDLIEEDLDIVERGKEAQNRLFYDCCYYLMQCDMATKQYDAVIRRGFEALTRECFRPQAYMMIGAAKYYQARFYDAVPFFKAALACEAPKNIMGMEQFELWRAYDYLSLCYTGMGQQAKAIEMANQALQHQPADPQRIILNLKAYAERLSAQSR